jgi:CRP/FNR family transcriptional regulator, cyclic AMP receptor protein
LRPLDRKGEMLIAKKLTADDYWRIKGPWLMRYRKE